VEYGTKLADISRALGELDADLSDLEASVDEVRAAIDEFDGRSWARSLETIDEAAAQTESDLDEVRSALDEIASKVRGFTSGSSSANGNWGRDELLNLNNSSRPQFHIRAAAARQP
jgi:hypothetical protein